MPPAAGSGQLLMAVVIGAASGAIGSFILLRRMALVGDALSHVALPGMALALAWHADPFWGVVATLLPAAPLIWWLERTSRLPFDAVVGLLFTTSLAIGVLTIPDTELLESLFGEFPALSPLQLGGTVAAAALALAFTLMLARPFLYRILSDDLSRSDGVGYGYDLLLLLLFALIVALGIKLAGTLLMGALTIIPAAVGRNVSTGVRRYVLTSSAVGAAISAGGLTAAAHWGVRPGPVIILMGGVLFLGTLYWVRRRPRARAL